MKLNDFFFLQWLKPTGGSGLDDMLKIHLNNNVITYSVNYLQGFNVSLDMSKTETVIK